MALIKCQECGKEISDSAVSCPHCGYKTSHGQREAQVKSQATGVLINCVLTFCFLILGIVLLCSGSSYINEYKSSYWGSYLWEAGYWKDDQEAVIAVVKIIGGIALIVGSVIDAFVLAFKAKALPSEPVKTISTVGYTNPGNSTPSASDATKWNSEYVPAWKRVQQEQNNDPQE